MAATLTFYPLLQVATNSQFSHTCKPCTDTNLAKSFQRPCNQYLRVFSPLKTTPSPSSRSSLLRGAKPAPKPGLVFSSSLSRCISHSALSTSSSFCLRQNSGPHLSNLLTTLSSLGLESLSPGAESRHEKNTSYFPSPSSLRRTSFPCVVSTTGSHRGGFKLSGRSRGFRGRASLRPRIRIWSPNRSSLGLRNIRHGARPQKTESDSSDEIWALRPSMQSTRCCSADGNIEAKLKQLPTSLISKHRYSRTLRSVFKCNCTSTENKETEGQEGEELRTETAEEEVSAGVKIAITCLKLYKPMNSLPVMLEGDGLRKERPSQGEISPLIPGSCRFVPTCSEYGMQAFKRYGVVKGAILTAWRLARCNPFGGSGFDPPRWFDEQNPSSY